INHLLRQRIERARRHDLFHARPGAREQCRIMRQIFPEIVDVIDLPRALDLVEHGADFRASFAILDRYSRHCPLSFAQSPSFRCRLSQAQRAGTIAGAEAQADKRERAKEGAMPKTPDYFSGKTICKIPFHSVHIVLKTVEIFRVKCMDAVEHGYNPQGDFHGSSAPAPYQSKDSHAHQDRSAPRWCRPLSANSTRRRAVMDLPIPIERPQP